MNDMNFAKMIIKSRIELKVKNGELTQEQADEIIQKLDGGKQ